jgi:hypothetical protein
MRQTLEAHARLSRRIRTTPYVDGHWVDVGESPGRTPAACTGPGDRLPTPTYRHHAPTAPINI